MFIHGSRINLESKTYLCITASRSTSADLNSFDGTSFVTDVVKLFVLLDKSGFGDDRIDMLPNDVPFLRLGVLTCDALKLTSILAIYGNVEHYNKKE